MPEFITALSCDKTVRRFLEKVSFACHPKGCIEWIAGKTTHGYGAFMYRNEKVYAHRFAYEQFLGDLPGELCVCHSCDNPLCVNPDHLWLGTRGDNNGDRNRKGRTVSVTGSHHWTRINPSKVCRGETQGSAKLTADDVLRIRQMSKDGYSLREIAETFGIDKGHAGKIVTRKSWQHV